MMPLPHNPEVSKLQRALLLLTARSSSRFSRIQHAHINVLIMHVKMHVTLLWRFLLQVEVRCRSSAVVMLLQVTCTWQLKERQVVTTIWANMQQLLTDKNALNSTLRWVVRSPDPADQLMTALAVPL
jgi:hypothetical protein